MSSFEVAQDSRFRVLQSPVERKVIRHEERPSVGELEVLPEPVKHSLEEGAQARSVSVHGGSWYHRSLHEPLDLMINGLYDTRKARERLRGERWGEYYLINPEGLVVSIPSNPRKLPEYDRQAAYGFSGTVSIEHGLPVLHYTEVRDLPGPLVSSLDTFFFTPFRPL